MKRFIAGFLTALGLLFAGQKCYDMGYKDSEKDNKKTK